MQLDVVRLAQELIAIDSASQRSNLVVSDLLERVLKRCAFDVERLDFVDANGERKVSLVAKKGSGTGGLAFISHSDTVPGVNWSRDPWSPVIEGGRLIGLGSCDMKGPLAATVVAAAGVDVGRLKRPVFVVVTADEETTAEGARQVAEESVLFRTQGPRHGVIAEPTGMIPVYAHKGGVRIDVTATGIAAHAGLDRGESANFRIAPFLGEMAELARRLQTDPSFQRPEFDPPTLGFNMTFDDGGCAPSVTAAKATCTLSLRPMPHDRSGEVIDLIADRARQCGFDVSSVVFPPFHISPDAEIVRAGLAATGAASARTMPFGTDAVIFQRYVDLIILGPGDVAQAHTDGEWIALPQLRDAVDVYAQMIDRP
jgi:acetylornithine deacetylase